MRIGFTTASLVFVTVTAHSHLSIGATYDERHYGLDGRRDLEMSAVAMGSREFHISATTSNDVRRGVDSAINRGVDVNARDTGGNSLLHWAVVGSTKEIVSTLLSKGADVDAVNHNKECPLWLAVGTGRPDIAELLIVHKANVNIRDGSYGQAPLHIAVNRGDKVMARLLLNYGANPNTRDDIRRTPLHSVMHIANTNGPLIAAMLIAHGAAIEAKDEYGNTPLHIAVKYRKPSSVAFCLRNGADVNAWNWNGDTPLGIAEDSSWHPFDAPIQTLLIKSGGMSVSTRYQVYLFGCPWLIPILIVVWCVYRRKRKRGAP